MRPLQLTAATEQLQTSVVTSSPLSPNAFALLLGRDSFAIRFTGMPEGIEIHEYSRTTTG